MGIFVVGEKFILIINRNFVGRMGYVDLEVYFVSLVVVVVLVIIGKILKLLEII